MENIKIMSFEEWTNKHYEYDLMGDLAILKRANETTFNSRVHERVEEIKDKLLNSFRPKKDKEDVKKFAYCLYYLNNFLGSNPMNFDNLLKMVNTGNPIYIEHLRIM